MKLRRAMKKQRLSSVDVGEAVDDEIELRFRDASCISTAKIHAEHTRKEPSCGQYV